MRLPVVVALALAMTSAIVASAAESHTARLRPVQGGMSAGNINHFVKRSCLGGTLGAFVTDGTNVYGLSNNHVFARENAAPQPGPGQVGEQIVQPGLIDVGCQKRTDDAIGTLTPYVPLSFGNVRRPGVNKVDAAMARMTNGVNDPDGRILNVGVPSSNIVARSEVLPGRAVQKAGRTTGVTKGQIDAVAASIVVNYGSGRYARFDDQITVTPGSFINGGDSGSLMLADESNPRAVGLLFAGSSAIAIASPIDTVLAELGQRNGVSLSMVGSGGLGSTASMPVPATAAPQTVSEPARAAKRQNQDRLLQLPDVVGVGVGRSSTIQVYLAQENGQTRRQIPASLDSVPVRVIVTGEITPR